MNPLLMTGICIVLFALTSYTIAFVGQIRTHSPTLMVRRFLTLGVALDVASTAFMIAGSRKIPFTFHGILGYSALLMMAIDMGLIWKRYRSHASDKLPASLSRYSIIAYSWWVLAFLAGTVVAILMN